MFKRRKARKAVEATFDALPGEAHAFADNPVISGTRPVGAWKALLAPVAAADELRDSKVREVTFTGKRMTEEALDDYGAGRFRDGISNQLRMFVVPLLDILGVEAGEQAQLALTLDLRGAVSDEKKHGQPTEQDPGMLRYPKIKEQMFHDPWCAGALELGDDSRLEFRCIDRVRQRRVTKRNPRGKIKTKTKVKTYGHREVRLAAKTDDYAWAPEQPEAAPGIRLKGKATDNRLTVRARRVDRFYEDESPPDLGGFIELMATVYGCVQPAGAGASVEGEQ